MTSATSLSSQVQRLKTQLEDKNRAAAAAASQNQHSVLQGHHHKARTQKERERVQIETAKKMASRFNLTYRALALSQAKLQQEHRARDLEAAKEAKEQAARYQMTFRALQMSSTGTKTGRVNVLDIDSAVRAAAENTPQQPQQHQEHEEEGYSTSATFQDLASLSVTAPPAEEEDNDQEDTSSVVAVESDAPSDTQNRLLLLSTTSSTRTVALAEEDLLSRISERLDDEDDEDPHDAFWLPDLSQALLQGNEFDINLAIVKGFFQQFDEQRVGEAEELLRAHAGREEQLMDALNMQYPASTTSRPSSSSDLGMPISAIPDDGDAPVAAVPVARPQSQRVAGMTLQSNGFAGGGGGGGSTDGYIVSAVKRTATATEAGSSNAWEINSPAESMHAALLRRRMQAKGFDAKAIDTVIGSESEML